MTLQQRISALITAIGADIKTLFGRSIPAGGSTGQVLAKTSATDYAVGWATASGGAAGNMNQAFASGTGGTSILDSETTIGSVTITPQSASSVIMIVARMTATKDATTTRRTVTARVKRSSTKIGVDCIIYGQNVASTLYGPAVISAIDSTHGVTTAITYNLVAVCSTTATSTSDDWEIFAVELMGAQGEKGDAGGELTDGDKGDITVTSPGGVTTLTIDNDVVTYAKMQNIATNQRVLGRTSGAGGNAEELSASAILDWIGASANSILYRGGSAWTALTPPVNKSLLTFDTSIGVVWSDAVFQQRIFLAYQVGVSAAGTNSSTATVLGTDTQFATITTVNSGTGVKIAYNSHGWFIFIKNLGANTLKVYPVTGGTINSLGTDVATTIVAGASQLFISTSYTNFQTILP